MDEADALAAALQARGVTVGDRVALAMRNYPEWMAVFMRRYRIGAVIVPVNSWGQPADIAYTVGDARVRLLSVTRCATTACAVCLEGEGIEAVIARPDRAEDPRGLAAFVAAFRGKAPAAVDIDGEDLAMIMYTSGTSGKPKGAASTHRAICQALYNYGVRRHRRRHDQRRADRCHAGARL